MKNKLPRLTPLLVIVAAIALVAPRDRIGVADGPDAPPDRSDDAPYKVVATQAKPRASDSVEQQPSGDPLLAQVAAQLERRASVSARLRHQALVSGKQLYGIGSYWQQGTGEELRVRLELQIAGQEANLLQVSNSRFLWVERRLPTGRTVSRVNLRQLRADTVLSGSPLDDVQPGKASWSSAKPGLLAHCGGLPSLLASLCENFAFLPPQAMRLAAPPGAEPQPASVPVYAIVGHWKQEKLAALFSPSGGLSVEGEESDTLNSPPSTLNSIPARLPQEVLLLVGQADLFPYRIEYRRLETPVAANQGGPPIPYQLSANPMVVLELTDVAFDVPIAAGQFDYAPSDADWVDQTAALLERIHREKQNQIAVRGSADRATLPAR